LWDTSYKDESWINEPVMLIPRMHNWVQNNYPGTRLAITEYNFGGLEDINGALTQADVLGIFGREGVDLAALWAPPDTDLPGAYAFRMYRNYDGHGSAFGGVSLPAESSDQEQLALFAARRTDQSLTVMVINKSGLAQYANLALNGFAPTPLAEVYRYSPENLHAIVRKTDQAVTTAGFWADLPADSITLFVLHPQPGSIRQVFLPFIGSIHRN
jgi:hypothetical protein